MIPLLAFLNRPYPRSTSPSTQRIIAWSIGLFIFLFLFFFRPFGLHQLSIPEALRATVAYGLTSTMVILLNVRLIPLLIPAFYREEKWTVGKEVASLLVMIFLIGLANIITTRMIFDIRLSWSSFIFFQLVTLSLAIFPVAGVILFKENRLLKANLEESQLINEKLYIKQRISPENHQTVNIKSESQSENFEYEAREILFITSADNYIDIHYLEAGSEKSKLIRSTLKSAREDLRLFTGFYRCHRAYIVNLDYVRSVSGNAQGCRLHLEGSENTIPVSRNLQKELRQRLVR